MIALLLCGTALPQHGSEAEYAKGMKALLLRDYAQAASHFDKYIAWSHESPMPEHELPLAIVHSCTSHLRGVSQTSEVSECLRPYARMLLQRYVMTEGGVDRKALHAFGTLVEGRYQEASDLFG